MNGTICDLVCTARRDAPRDPGLPSSGLSEDVPTIPNCSSAQEQGQAGESSSSSKPVGAGKCGTPPEPQPGPRKNPVAMVGPGGPRDWLGPWPLPNARMTQILGLVLVCGAIMEHGQPKRHGRAGKLEDCCPSVLEQPAAPAFLRTNGPPGTPGPPDRSQARRPEEAKSRSPPASKKKPPTPPPRTPTGLRAKRLHSGALPA